MYGRTGTHGAGSHSPTKLWTELLKGYRIREGNRASETARLAARVRQRKREGARSGEELRARRRADEEKEREKKVAGRHRERGPLINILIRPSHVPRVLYL